EGRHHHVRCLGSRALPLEDQLADALDALPVHPELDEFREESVHVGVREEVIRGPASTDEADLLPQPDELLRHGEAREHLRVRAGVPPAPLAHPAHGRTALQVEQFRQRHPVALGREELADRREGVPAVEEPEDQSEPAAVLGSVERGATPPDGRREEPLLLVETDVAHGGAGLGRQVLDPPQWIRPRPGHLRRPPTAGRTSAKNTPTATIPTRLIRPNGRNQKASAETAQIPIHAGLGHLPWIEWAEAGGSTPSTTPASARATRASRATVSTWPQIPGRVSITPSSYWSGGRAKCTAPRRHSTLGVSAGRRRA